MTEEELIVPLELENGDVIDCAVISIFEVDGNSYIALLPEDTEEILLYRYKESGEDQITLENIESDYEFNRALEVFDGLIVEEDDNNEDIEGN